MVNPPNSVPVAWPLWSECNVRPIRKLNLLPTITWHHTHRVITISPTQPNKLIPSFSPQDLPPYSYTILPPGTVLLRVTIVAVALHGFWRESVIKILPLKWSWWAQREGRGISRARTWGHGKNMGGWSDTWMTAKGSVIGHLTIWGIPPFRVLLLYWPFFK